MGNYSEPLASYELRGHLHLAIFRHVGIVGKLGLVMR